MGPDGNFSLALSASYLYVVRLWLIVNLIIVLTYWWLPNTEMYISEFQNTSAVKLEHMPSKLPKSKQPTEFTRLGQTIDYSGEREGDRPHSFISSE